MNKRMETRRAETRRAETKKEYAIDIVKDVLKWFVVTALAFVYWMAMLLLGSLFLMNIWHTNFEQILQISFVLMSVTSVVYLGILVHRRLA